MIIGYARTSTREQDAGLAAQVRELKKLGCEKIYKEQVSSVAERPELDRLLDAIRAGDKLVVTKLDRLARSVIDLGKIVERLQAAGVDLQIVAMGVDTATATGKLMLNVLGSVAQFEREMMLERQRDGIEKANIRVARLRSRRSERRRCATRASPWWRSGTGWGLAGRRYIARSVSHESPRTKSSIHSELIKLGFLDYVADARRSGSNELWPDLSSRQAQVTASFSKWWGRYVRQHGLTDDRQVFHSFRHLVKRQLRNARVEKALVDALQGHAAQDVADRVYGLDEEGFGVALPILKDAIEELNYPGLDLKYLYARRAAQRA